MMYYYSLPDTTEFSVRKILGIIIISFHLELISLCLMMYLFKQITIIIITIRLTSMKYFNKMLKNTFSF